MKSLAELDGFLSPAKARVARRRTFAGLGIDAALFAARGLELSPAEQRELERWQDGALTSRLLDRHRAADGSRRLVIGLADDETVETVAMPVGAACVSTQVGCAVGCRFCASGIDGLRRNLSATEIVEQVIWARREMRVDRVVFMGIGEPSHNARALTRAVALLARDGLISPRKQTVSTVGSPQFFDTLAAASVRPCLALSLHTADAELRRQLLPRAPRHTPAELVAAADRYAAVSGTPVQFEWTVLAGVNDGDADVDALCDLVGGARGYVNFILWNEVAGLPFRRPDRDRVVEMLRTLRRRGILATIRDSAGADVRAACGQLRRAVRG